MTNERNTILELAAQYLAEDLQRGDAMTAPAAVETFLRCKLDGRTEECFCALFLDTRHRVIAFEELFHGTIDGAAVYPRVVAKRALELNAAAMIIAHNHPSGCTGPSEADKAMTRRIKEAMALLDIRLLDHFVIGDGKPFSFATAWLL